MMFFFGLNLLPPEEKDKLRRFRVSRFVFSYCLALTALFIIFVVLLWLLTAALKWNLNVVEKRIDSERKLTQTQEVGDLEKKIIAANDVFSLAASTERQRTESARAIADFVSLVPSGITLKTLKFDVAGGRFDVEGEAGIRNDFIGFEEAIKSAGAYDNLDSPISNLLKQADFSFRLSFSLKKN